MKAKKRLTQEQEFEIMKLVLDKFLWLGFAIMLYGMWRIFNFGFGRELGTSISIIVAGAIVLVVFMVLIVKEYEIIK